jgi:hypothetical protein
MRLARCSFLLLLGVCASGPACAAPPVFDYCACPELSSHDANGQRDGAFGASIVVPFSARRVFNDGDDSNDVTWTNGTLQVSLGGWVGGGLVPFDQPRQGQCLLTVDHRRVLIEGYDRKGKRGVVAYFELNGDKTTRFAATVLARNKAAACSLAAKTIWSARFGGHSVTSLRVLGIARDRKSFLYENAPGAVMSGHLGDVVLLSYDKAKVKEISASSVTIAGVIPDGAGGWKEVETVLYLDGHAPANK